MSYLRFLTMPVLAFLAMVGCSSESEINAANTASAPAAVHSKAPKAKLPADAPGEDVLVGFAQWQLKDNFEVIGVGKVASVESTGTAELPSYRIDYEVDVRTLNDLYVLGNDQYEDLSMLGYNYSPIIVTRTAAAGDVFQLLINGEFGLREGEWRWRGRLASALPGEISREVRERLRREGFRFRYETDLMLTGTAEHEELMAKLKAHNDKAAAEKQAAQNYFDRSQAEIERILLGSQHKAILRIDSDMVYGYRSHRTLVEGDQEIILEITQNPDRTNKHAPYVGVAEWVGTGVKKRMQGKFMTLKNNGAAALDMYEVGFVPRHQPQYSLDDRRVGFADRDGRYIFMLSGGDSGKLEIIYRRGTALHEMPLILDN